jgi:hypothetical protein
MWVYNSSWGGVKLIKHRDKFTFTFTSSCAAICEEAGCKGQDKYVRALPSSVNLSSMCRAQQRKWLRWPFLVGRNIISVVDEMPLLTSRSRVIAGKPSPYILYFRPIWAPVELAIQETWSCRYIWFGGNATPNIYVTLEFSAVLRFQLAVTWCTESWENTNVTQLTSRGESRMD